MVHTYSDKNNPGTGLIGDILVSFKDCIATGGLNIEEFFVNQEYTRENYFYIQLGELYSLFRNIIVLPREAE